MKTLTFNSISCRTGNCRAQVSLWGQKAVDITDLDIQDSDHPNLSPFKGTLLLVDESSDQPPHGSDGHLIYVPKALAEKRLKTLPGMAVNYQNDLEGHNPSKKIGVITKAWLEGNKVKVEGVIWRKDFPEALRTFRMNRGRLGMSMELGDVFVRDKDEAVWHLEDFHFTGATILKKDHAAYESTELAASKQHFVKALAAARSARAVIQGKRGQPEMAKEKEKKSSSGQQLVGMISAAVEKGMGNALKSLVEEQKKSNEAFSKTLEGISASQEELVKGFEAMMTERVDAAKEDDEDSVIDVKAESSNPSDATMTSARRNASEASDASDGSEASDGTDPSDATEMDASASDPTNYDATEQDDAEPGDLNKDASSNYREQSRGPASSRIQKSGKTGKDRGIAAGRASVRSMAAAAVAIKRLTAENVALKEERKRFKNRVAALEASVDRYADRVERRTITPEISALLEKGGHDVRELMASKQKLTVSEVDDLFLKANIQLDPTMRAAFKNQLVQVGLMENGEIRRFN